MNHLPVLLAAALASAGAMAQERPSQTEDAVQIGVLACQSDSTPTEQAALVSCLFERSSGRGERYTGHVQPSAKAGGRAVEPLVWAVYASPGREPAGGLTRAGVLAGRYEGSAPSEGGLIGPAGRIALEPMTGAREPNNQAAAVSGLDLERPR